MTRNKVRRKITLFYFNEAKNNAMGQTANRIFFRGGDVIIPSHAQTTHGY